MIFDNSNNVLLDSEKPKIETVREVHLDYSESMGDAYRSISIEMLATFKELRKVIRELLAGDVS